MESATRARGPYAKTVERRSAVARAALEIVLEKGHRAITTAEVASRAGMSETAMLYHFPTRDHILVAAMELADSDSRTVLTDQFLGSEAQQGEWPPPELARLSAEDEAVTRLFFALSAEAVNTDHPAHQYLKDHQEQTVLHFADGIRRRQSNGYALPGLDPHAVARQVAAVWSGLRMQWLVNPTFDLASEVSQAFKALTGQSIMEAKRSINDLVSRM
ncbi:TetR/AcrR family transcriptional regulator [Pseudarthrobacter sp. NamE2]|uniref:TetR/AcrR family transcriptional regulator n=1 Tax=Pseudarthrobacter sp. NamE2 TaxID=2576838 RepID=UPI0010FF35EC|nr:TetR/AcrR family transcriptional regulator [Pseudarthrobacter sp. NamE2]TLM83559.1 TetR/AcrR family transcriptional regulator [Pseudarthrobacter sp. NamE2]